MAPDIIFQPANQANQARQPPFQSFSRAAGNGDPPAWGQRAWIPPSMGPSKQTPPVSKRPSSKRTPRSKHWAWGQPEGDPSSRACSHSSYFHSSVKNFCQTAQAWGPNASEDHFDTPRFQLGRDCRHGEDAYYPHAYLVFWVESHVQGPSCASCLE
jgi:hypothetical protein